MSSVPRIKSTEEIISGILRRLFALETGGKEMAGISGLASGSITLDSGEQINSLYSTLSWVDEEETKNPAGTPYISVFVDTDGDVDYLWPYGASLSAEQLSAEISFLMDEIYLANYPEQCRARIFIKNIGASSHTYYIRVKWVYFKAGSGSE